MSVTAGVADVALAVRDKLRGKIGQTKVKRYWPGKAPEWADDADEEIEIRASRAGESEKPFPSQEEDEAFRAPTDARLRRLAQSRIENREEAREVHRRIRQAEIISTEEEDARGTERADLEEEDEDALDERRQRLKAKARELEEEAVLPEEEDEELPEEDEDEESEYETDSDEETLVKPMVKPIFKPKSERDTIAERERIEREEMEIEEKARKKLEERRVETKQLLVEEIKKEEMIQKNLENESNKGDIETDDEMNEAEEYEAWKVREISRIKRDREDREQMVKEREEIERVRNMTDAERREWERKNPKTSSQPKQKWKFMQKYYHKGAFFQEDGDDRAATAGTDDIFKRDYSAPTGEDKMDKSILPKVMQVKHFGRSGRTKWTHLVNEDTTDWNDPYTVNDPLRAKYNAKMAAMNAPIAKPKGSKKLNNWEKP